MTLRLAVRLRERTATQGLFRQVYEGGAAKDDGANGGSVGVDGACHLRRELRRGAHLHVWQGRRAEAARVRLSARPLAKEQVGAAADWRMVLHKLLLHEHGCDGALHAHEI